MITGQERPSHRAGLTSASRFRSGRPRPPRLPQDTPEQLEKAKEEVATLPALRAGRSMRSSRAPDTGVAGPP
ncbi:hypothetical protein [Streptomyces sp. Agncl-13]|uniref:hypothetical protein n=1 Tax=Streptomyces sp. Agncl-13 TaxID=3400628 RepID=UPI003A853FE0